MDHTRIAIIDEHPLFFAGLKFTFDAEADLVLVGHGGSSVESLRICRELKPNIIILEMELSNDNQQVSELLNDLPGAKVILIGNCTNTKLISSALQSGASGYVSRKSSAAEVIHAVRCVRSGEIYVTPALAVQLLTAIKPRGASEPDRFADLTDREEQIVRLLGIGLSNKEIGWRLTISEKTVKHYLTSILGKLNVRNRVQAALLVAHRQQTYTYA